MKALKAFTTIPFETTQRSVKIKISANSLSSSGTGTGRVNNKDFRISPYMFPMSIFPLFSFWYLKKKNLIRTWRSHLHTFCSSNAILQVNFQNLRRDYQKRFAGVKEKKRGKIEAVLQMCSVKKVLRRILQNSQENTYT